MRMQYTRLKKGCTAKTVSFFSSKDLQDFDGRRIYKKNTRFCAVFFFKAHTSDNRRMCSRNSSFLHIQAGFTRMEREAMRSQTSGRSIKRAFLRRQITSLWWCTVVFGSPCSGRHCLRIWGCTFIDWNKKLE